MPKPNPLNPKCPYCDRLTTRNGTANNDGVTQAYRCRKCNWTCVDSDRLPGGQAAKDPSNNPKAVYARQWRAKKKRERCLMD